MNWKDVELSAYLDGQLPEARRIALEQALAHDAALRARLDALRHTVTLLRASPLHDVPRNFLLTPSMVAEPRRAQLARRWYPFTRLATALTAIALVITLGLQTLPVMLPAPAPVQDTWTAPVGAPKTVAPLPEGTTEPAEGVTILSMPEPTPTDAPRRTAPVEILEPQPDVTALETPTVGLAAPQAVAPAESDADVPTAPPKPTDIPAAWLGALSAALALLTLMFGATTLWLSRQR